MTGATVSGMVLLVDEGLGVTGALVLAESSVGPGVTGEPVSSTPDGIGVKTPSIGLGVDTGAESLVGSGVIFIIVGIGVGRVLATGFEVSSIGAGVCNYKKK